MAQKGLLVCNHLAVMLSELKMLQIKHFSNPLQLPKNGSDNSQKSVNNSIKLHATKHLETQLSCPTTKLLSQPRYRL